MTNINFLPETSSEVLELFQRAYNWDSDNVTKHANNHLYIYSTPSATRWNCLFDTIGHTVGTYSRAVDKIFNLRLNQATWINGDGTCVYFGFGTVWRGATVDESYFVAIEMKQTSGVITYKLGICSAGYSSGTYYLNFGDSVSFTGYNDSSIRLYDLMLTMTYGKTNVMMRAELRIDGTLVATIPSTFITAGSLFVCGDVIRFIYAAKTPGYCGAWSLIGKVAVQ